MVALPEIYQPPKFLGVFRGFTVIRPIPPALIALCIAAGFSAGSAALASQ